MPLKTPKHHILRLILIGFAVLLVIATCLAYPLRGWIRSDGVAWYARTFYLSDLHHHYTKSFEPVNKELAKFGFSFDKVTVNECYEPQYQGFGVSTSCEQGTVSNKLVPTELQPKWHASSANFEKFLYAQGWSKDNNSSDIMTQYGPRDANQSFTNQIGYQKTFGATTCYLTLINDQNGREAFVREGCYRNIKFFGGY